MYRYEKECLIRGLLGPLKVKARFPESFLFANKSKHTSLLSSRRDDQKHAKPDSF